jgi:hypothetical protein
MPKKSITLNGFTGGINKDTSPYDASSKGRGEDEIPGNLDGGTGDGILNTMLDEKGKISTAFIRPVASSLSENITSTSPADEQNFILHTNEAGTKTAYRHPGVYSIGQDVNWSGNVDYQATSPSNGALNPGTLTQQTDGVDIKFEIGNLEGFSVFLGKDSSLNADSDQAYILNSEVTAMPGPARYFKAIADGDGDGKMFEGQTDWYANMNASEDRWSFQTAAGDASANNTGAVETDAKVNESPNYEYDDSSGTWASSGGSNGKGGYINLDCRAGREDWTSSINTDLSDAQTIDFYQGNSQNVRHAVFKAGYNSSSALSDSETPSGEGSFTGYGWHTNGSRLRCTDIVNKDIYVDIKLNISTGFRALSIWFDNDDNDPEFHHADSNFDSYGKVFELSKTSLISAGAMDGFVTVKIPHSTFIHIGTNYSDSDVRQIGIGAVYESNGDQNKTNKPAFQLRGFKLVDSTESQSTWGGSHYIFYQTKVSNGVESLPKAYNAPYDGENAVFPHKLTISKPTSELSGKSGKIYYQKSNPSGSTYGNKFLAAEWDYINGVKPADQDDFTAWESNAVSIDILDAPINSTYSFETGYPEGTTDINAEWKHAAVVGRQVYIGNVRQPAGSGDYDASKILKSPPGSPAGFSDKSYIDLDFGGVTITAMETSGDRLFCFSDQVLFIINIAQDIEFLEATMPGYGISEPRKVVKVDEGLVFVNDSGVYHFDGSKMKSLSSEKMSNHLWSTVDVISYFHNRKIVILWDNNRQGHMYSFKTSSWVNMFATNVGLIAPRTKSIVGVDGSKTYYYCVDHDGGGSQLDNELVYLGMHDSSANYYHGLYKGDDVHVNFKLITGFIDCGSPAREKKFYKFRIRVKNARYLQWAYCISGKNIGADGHEDTGAWLDPVVGTKVHGEIELDISDATVGDTGKSIQLRLADNYNSGTDSDVPAGAEGPGADFIIEEITLIYREKTVK